MISNFTQPIWSIRDRLCAGRMGGLVRGELGSSMVELALVVSLLGTPLLLGTGEMGLVVYDSIEVSNAASAGAYYAMQSSTFAGNTTGISTAAKAEAADVSNSLSVTSSTYYACSAAIAGTQYTGTNAQADATSGCTGTGNHPLEFVKVTVSDTITPGIRLPSLAGSFALSRTAVMEVEQ
jgi:Flp pilus assembly protein TadG